MYTKQEKLAAARKKLKEFQGKQRENDINRTKNVISGSGDASYKDSIGKIPDQTSSYCTSELSPTECKHFQSSYYQNTVENPNYVIRCSAIKESDSVSNPESAFATFPRMTLAEGNLENPNVNAISSVSMAPSDNFDSIFNENSCGNFHNTANKSLLNYANGLFGGEAMTYITADSSVVNETSDSNKLNTEMCTWFKDPEIIGTEQERNSNILQRSHTTELSNDPKDFFWTTFNSGSVPNEMESQNKEKLASSFSELVGENANLAQVLKRTEELLKYKTDQEQSLSQNLSLLQSKLTSLEGSLCKAENEKLELQLKNEELIKQRDIDNKVLENIKDKYESKLEQFSELQQKLELKTQECEYRSVKLQEIQSQLSSSLIKIQQLSTGESPALNLQMSELQNENSVLTKKLLDLEKNLDIVNKEKEESSHNFQTYAQQCNSQLNSLSSEVRNLVKENRLLTEKNIILEKNIKDLESEKNELKLLTDHPEVASLNVKLSELTEENNSLKNHLKEKEDGLESLQKEKKEKMEEMNRMYNTLQELRSENLKLIEEREATNNNEKLLAAMESDKVAAARAVSQNQKLKDQIAELEEGFIKLSHEKLHLTDELAHEKHLKKELEFRLQDLQANHCHDHDNHHHKSSDSTINESADVEELKNIIRQLEEDKTELLSRLNSSNSVKAVNYSNEIGDADNQENPYGAEYRPAESEDSDNSKILLQQMEEKVKKTMNEIATLDEEKEKLEHLVLQLQGETETIGEYVSLYQTQRMLLRQRSKEKDEQLLQLSKDKEELKTKLSTLNDLVNHLLTEKGNECKEIMDMDTTVHSSVEYSEATAAKIQSLITEIQSTNLINNHSIAFEHCPCCSGRLITI